MKGYFIHLIYTLVITSSCIDKSRETKLKKDYKVSFKEDLRNAERAVLIACAPMLLTSLLMILAAIAY
mgnify:CR=1 FL=1